ncbi:Deoxyribose-phosphate aldolase [Chlamydiales bacterium STE3]|nr:Deoxyribose-phosphate aldolase [Chlamydiales bacterium STE3]
MFRSLNKYIDHTLLKPECNAGGIKRLCQEAIQHDFATVCILPVWVPFAKLLLKDSSTKVCSVVGFPLGANTSEAKAFEAQQLFTNGADELDIVMNLSFLKSKKYQEVILDIRQIVETVPQAIIKVIIETSLLTNDEKRIAAKICIDSGAHFVKTSTGFFQGGAEIDDIVLLKQVVGERCGIKASGGIDSAQKALSMIAAGANRIGTSKGVILLEKGWASGS